MSNAVASQMIHISSKDRINGSSSDYTILLKDRDLNDYQDLSIQKISIPFSYYAINSNNNVITLGATAGLTATITPGNYTTSSFLTEFITKAPIGITGAYNSTTSKFSFGSTDNSAWNITTDTRNYRYLGLPKSTVCASVSGIITSSNVVNMSGTQEIQILCDIPMNSSNTYNYNNNVLVSIYPNALPGGMIQYTNENFAHIKLDTQRIGLTRFTLIDDNHDTIDLGGLDWSMTLLLTSRDQ